MFISKQIRCVENSLSTKHSNPKHPKTCQNNPIVVMIYYNHSPNMIISATILNMKVQNIDVPHSKIINH